MSDGGRAGTSSAAKRTRERHLRAAWRHEQLSVRMVLAAASTAPPRSVLGPRRTKPCGDRREPGQRQVYSTSVSTSTKHTRSSPHRCLDVPVPLMEEQLLMDVFRPYDRQVPELVIDVPKIICEDIPTRSSVPEPQLVEQLVEMTTLLSVAVLQQRTAAREEEELLAVPTQLRTPAQWARLWELIGASSRARRRKKKRRKRKAPRGSSSSFLSCSHCSVLEIWTFLALCLAVASLQEENRKVRLILGDIFRLRRSYLAVTCLLVLRVA